MANVRNDKIHLVFRFVALKYSNKMSNCYFSPDKCRIHQSIVNNYKICILLYSFWCFLSLILGYLKEDWSEEKKIPFESEVNDRILLELKFISFFRCKLSMHCACCTSMNRISFIVHLNASYYTQHSFAVVCLTTEKKERSKKNLTLLQARIGVSCVHIL